MTKQDRWFQKRKKIQADENFLSNFPVFYVFFRVELTIPDRMAKEKRVLLLECT